jgi:phosphotransferase system HPr (HPr) family protein
MIQREVVVTLAAGLHVRPAARIVEKASRFLSKVSLVVNGKKANCRSIFQIIGLHASLDSRVRIVASGADELEAVDEIRKLFDLDFCES